MQAGVDVGSESDRDIPAATSEGFIKGRRDGPGRVIDDAGVALELVTQPVVLIGQEPPGLMERGEQVVGVVA